MDNLYRKLADASSAVLQNQGSSEHLNEYFSALEDLRAFQKGMPVESSMTLHALANPATEQDLALFRSGLQRQIFGFKDHQAAYQRIFDTPRIKLCDMSRIALLLFEDTEKYIPESSRRVRALCESTREVTDSLIDAIMEAMNRANTTSYYQAQPGEVGAFLLTHYGKRIFTIVW